MVEIVRRAGTLEIAYPWLNPTLQSCELFSSYDYVTYMSIKSKENSVNSKQNNKTEAKKNPSNISSSVSCEEVLPFDISLIT